MDTKVVETWHTYLCHYLTQSNTHTHTHVLNILCMSKNMIVQHLHSRQLRLRVRIAIRNRTQQTANWRDFSAMALLVAVIIICIGNAGRET